MTQIVLGIGHKARHGKDSFARAVEDYYGNLNAAVSRHGHGKVVVVQRLAFADALRKETNEWLSGDEGRLWATGADWCAYIPEVVNGVADSRFTIPSWVTPDPKPEINSITPLGKHSKLLQWWGTQYRRAQDPDYWVKKWKERISKQADIVMTTDMRFLNEAAAIREVGGFTVDVVRLNPDGRLYVDPTRPADHISEIELDGYNFDYAIHSKDSVLTGEFAITLVHFLRARAGKGS